MGTELDRYRMSVEMNLVSDFEQQGVSYWTARDVALDTVTKSHRKAVTACHKRRLSAKDCAKSIIAELRKRAR